MSPLGPGFCMNGCHVVGTVNLGIFSGGQSLPVHTAIERLVCAGWDLAAVTRQGRICSPLSQMSSLTVNRDSGVGLIAFDNPYSSKFPQ